MKFITFLKENNQHIGVYNHQNQLVDLTLVGSEYPYFLSMLDLIRGGKEALETVNQVIESSQNSDDMIQSEHEITMLAPIPRPQRNIYCIGLNYAEHNQEFSSKNAPLPEVPIVFSKVPSTVIGHEATIETHSEITKELDYEAELAVILGRGGRDISKETAFDYVFGYTIINDITARDLQRKHQQWFLGKSLDTTCPMGPYLVHKSAIATPEKLAISSRVNSELRQSSNTEHMIFDIPTIIATISKGHTLEAGDIIATGTCAGVGMGFNPPKFLRSGDVVEVEIEGIGILRNYLG